MCRAGRRLIASYEGRPLQFSNFHRFAATATCNPPDIKCIKAFREKAKLYFGRNTENWADYFSRCVNHSIDVEFGRRSFQFAILRSRNFCRHDLRSSVPSFFFFLPDTNKREGKPDRRLLPAQ